MQTIERIWTLVVLVVLNEKILDFVFNGGTRKGEQVCPLLTLTVMPASNVIAPTSQLSAALQNNHILCLV